MIPRRRDALERLTFGIDLMRGFSLRLGMTTHRSAWPTADGTSDVRASEMYYMWRAIHHKLVERRNFALEACPRGAGSFFHLTRSNCDAVGCSGSMYLRPLQQGTHRGNQATTVTKSPDGKVFRFRW